MRICCIKHNSTALLGIANNQKGKTLCNKTEILNSVSEAPSPSCGGKESNLIFVKYLAKSLHSGGNLQKAIRYLIVTELALDFSAWKSSPTANAHVLDSPGFPVELPGVRMAPLCPSLRHKSPNICLLIDSLVA